MKTLTVDELERAIDAVDRIRKYVATRDAQPMLGLGDCIHIVHRTTEHEARLLLSDLRLALKTIPC